MSDESCSLGKKRQANRSSAMEVQVVWRMHNSFTLMKPFITRENVHYGRKGSNEGCQLDYLPPRRSVEESTPSSLLALELTGQL